MAFPEPAPAPPALAETPPSEADDAGVSDESAGVSLGATGDPLLLPVAEESGVGAVMWTAPTRKDKAGEAAGAATSGVAWVCAGESISGSEARKGSRV